MHVILYAVGALVTLVGGALMRFGLPLDEYGNSPLLISGTVALVGGLILIALATAVRSLARIAERLDIQPLPLPPMADIGHPAPAPRATAPLPPPPAPPAEKAEPTIAIPEPAPAPVPEARMEPALEVAPPRPPAAKPPPKSLLGWLGGKPPRAPEVIGRKDVTPPPIDAGTPGRIDIQPLARGPDREPTLRPAPAPNPAPAPAPAPSAGNGAAPQQRLEVPAGGVAVYKSGVIDGMAYTLYTDGSIEAELPRGRIRFASVDALQNYLAGR